MCSIRGGATTCSVRRCDEGLQCSAGKQWMRLGTCSHKGSNDGQQCNLSSSLGRCTILQQAACESTAHAVHTLAAAFC